MTRRRLRTAGVLAAAVLLPRWTVAAAPAAPLSDDGPAAVGPSRGSMDPGPDFVLELLVEFVDGIADGWW